MNKGQMAIFMAFLWALAGYIKNDGWAAVAFGVCALMVGAVLIWVSEKVRP